MDDKDFRPRSALPQTRHRPILSPDQQQQRRRQEATANPQPDATKKKTPPPRPRRELRLHSPPPVLPARNPLRSPSGVVLPPREQLRVAEIWDPEIGHYVKRLADGRFGGVVDDGMPGSSSGGRRFGGGDFGGPNAHRTPSVRIPPLSPGMEIALRDGSTAATGSQTQGMARSRSVNESRINNTTTPLRAPTPRLLNLTDIDRPLSDPSASGPGRELNRRVHEHVNNLRQAYIHNLHINEFETEFRTDDEVLHTNARPSTPIYELSADTPYTPPPPRPTTPLHRSNSNPSASSSAQQASARNFSLPSYGSPSANEEQEQQRHALESRSMSGPLYPQQQQQQQQFPLESRSMSGPLPLPSTSSRWNLHVGNGAPMAAVPTTPVQDTPRRPLRRVRSKSVSLGRIAEASDAPKMPAKKLGWWDEVEEEAVEDGRIGGVHGEKNEREGAGHGSGTGATAVQIPKTATTTTTTTPTKPKRKVWKEVDVVEEELVEEAKEEEEEEACGRCKSIRRALARNPLCCVDRAKMRRLCFKCWSEALAEGLKTDERQKWLCCVVCGRELLSGDAKRLASRGTILR
jgi:hypothetical protein